MSAQLEHRYIVFKLTDLVDDEKLMLLRIGRKVASRRMVFGKPVLSGVYIESDWPEYQPTVDALLARASGEPQRDAALLQEAKNLHEWLDRVGAPRDCHDGWADVPWSLRGRVEVMLSRTRRGEQK